MKYKNITLDYITKHLNSHLVNKGSDIRITHTDEIFFAEIYTGKNKVSTGKGGLIMFLKELGNNLDLFKVEYNSIILNKEEKEQLISELFK